MKSRTIAAALLALALPAGAAAAQPATSLKDQIVGTWNFVVAEVAAPEGKKSFPFGETPKGILIFTADGHFAQLRKPGSAMREVVLTHLPSVDIKQADAVALRCPIDPDEPLHIVDHC